MAGVFVLGGEAHITAKDRFHAFAGLGNIVEEELHQRLPQLDTPQLRDLSDDIANRLIDAYFEEPDTSEPVDLREVQRFYQGPGQ